MMESLRETFHLEKYSEEAVEEVVHMMMGPEKIPTEDIAKAVRLPVEDVDEIISSTFQVWGH